MTLATKFFELLVFCSTEVKVLCADMTGHNTQKSLALSILVILYHFLVLIRPLLYWPLTINLTVEVGAQWQWLYIPVHWTFESEILVLIFLFKWTQTLLFTLAMTKLVPCFGQQYFLKTYLIFHLLCFFFIPSTFANLSKIGLPDFSAELKHQDLMSDSLFCVGVLLVEANLGWGCPALFPSLHFS